MQAVGSREAGSESLVAIIIGDMFSKAIQGLTLVSNASHQGEIMALIRDILVRPGPSNHSAGAVTAMLYSTPNVYPLLSRSTE